MNITIVGASAGVGLETLKRALQRGHTVTTLSRSDIAFPENNSLKKLKGSALHPEDLSNAINTADALIVTLGTGNSRKATTLYSDFARLLLQVAAAKSFSGPVLVVTGFGAGESGRYNSFFMRILFRLLLKAVYQDKTAMEEMISHSALKWMIVRPGRLTNGPLTEVYRKEERLFQGMGIGSINRSDVADYLVKQAENPTDLYKHMALSNK